MEAPDVQPKEESGNPLSDIPIEITVSVGRARPTVKDVLALEAGAVLTLDKRIDDPVELYVGDRLIAIGVLDVEVSGDEEALVVRLTEVVGLKAPS